MIALPKGDGAGRFHAAHYWKLAGSGWDYLRCRGDGSSTGSGWDYLRCRGDGSSTGYSSGAGDWYYITPYTSKDAVHPFACTGGGFYLYPHYAVIS